MSARLFHRSWGEARPRALFLVHPLGADSTFWEAAAGILSREHYCVACDLRSAGRSPVAGWPLSVDDHVSDLEALVEAIGLRTVVAVGCAVGAVVAAAFAARNQARVEAVVLSNPTANFPPEAQEMLARRGVVARRGSLEPLVEDVVGRAFDGMPADGRRGAFEAQLRRQPAVGYADLAEGIAAADITADLRGLDRPALLLTSGHDVLLPPSRAEAIRKLMTKAQLRRVAEGAHFIPYQAPRPFAAAVEDFLRALPQNETA